MQAVSDLFDPAVIDDPYPMYAALRRTAPVCRITGTDFFLASTADAVQEATADDPHHAAERKLVLPGLVAKRIRALEPFIERTAERLWSGSASGGGVEWMSAIADRLPMTLVAKLIGLPEADVAQLVDWGYGSTELVSGVVTDDRLPVVVDAAVQLAAYLHDAFGHALDAPGDDLLGDLARAAKAGQVERHVAVLMLVQLVGAGGESTAGLIGNAARMLATHDDLQKVVRADRNVLPAVIEETLRLEAPFRAHHRHVTGDTMLAGLELPAGSHLLLLWGSANRDPAAFADADEVRLDRANLRGHLAFGKGLHFCVGAALARTEARIALRTLLEHTESFSLTGAEWLPSLLVRRHRRRGGGRRTVGRKSGVQRRRPARARGDRVPGAGRADFGDPCGGRISGSPGVHRSACGGHPESSG